MKLFQKSTIFHGWNIEEGHLNCHCKHLDVEEQIVLCQNIAYHQLYPSLHSGKDRNSPNLSYDSKQLVSILVILFRVFKIYFNIHEQVFNFWVFWIFNIYQHTWTRPEAPELVVWPNPVTTHMKPSGIRHPTWAMQAGWICSPYRIRFFNLRTETSWCLVFSKADNDLCNSWTVI